MSNVCKCGGIKFDHWTKCMECYVSAISIHNRTIVFPKFKPLIEEDLCQEKTEMESPKTPNSISIGRSLNVTTNGFTHEDKARIAKVVSSAIQCANAQRNGETVQSTQKTNVRQESSSKEKKKMKKKFETIVGESLGWASMCWSETPKGTFDPDQCLKAQAEIMKAFHEEMQRRFFLGYALGGLFASLICLAVYR